MSGAKKWLQDNVSRETFENLEKYENVLRKWQKSINLVAKSTLDDIWGRHFQDSLQLLGSLNNVSRETVMVDLGSGAGFPGMVLSIAMDHPIHLIESDQRKCAFLRDVSRETSATAQIHNDRIENVAIQANIITSRAFASIAKTLEISAHMLQENTIYCLLKPQDIDKELTEATKYWYFDAHSQPSVSDPRGCILQLKNVKQKA